MRLLIIVKARRDNSGSCERSELHPAQFICLVLLNVAAGAALVMYPAVFFRQEALSDTPSRIAFLGFCVLCALLAAYIWDRQAAIRRLRR